MCLRHGPTLGRLEGRIPSARVSAVGCSCFAGLGAERKEVDETKKNRTKRVPKATKIELQGCLKRHTWSQHGAKISKFCSKVKPWSV